MGRATRGEAARARVLAAPRRRRPGVAAGALRRDVGRLRRARRRRDAGVSAAVDASPSPFKGLAPFGDSDLDALLFFGRERESEIIAANLMAARVTVLYGPSGVGKTSVLRAGVAYRLRREDGVEVVVFSSWPGNPVRSLIDAIGGGASLADACADAANRAGGDLY